MAGRWLLRVASFVVGIVLVGVLAGLVLKGPDLVKNIYSMLTYPPLNGSTGLFFVGAVLVFFVALPLAIADGLASKRFRDAEARLRKLRPDAIVSEYEGPEGAGLKFQTATSTTLLLRPIGGLGKTRMLELPPPAEWELPSTFIATDGPARS